MLRSLMLFSFVMLPLFSHSQESRTIVSKQFVPIAFDKVEGYLAKYFAKPVHISAVGEERNLLGRFSSDGCYDSINSDCREMTLEVDKQVFLCILNLNKNVSPKRLMIMVRHCKSPTAVMDDYAIPIPAEELGVQVFRQAKD